MQLGQTLKYTRFFILFYFLNHAHSKKLQMVLSITEGVCQLNVVHYTFSLTHPQTKLIITLAIKSKSEAWTSTLKKYLYILIGA